MYEMKNKLIYDTYSYRVYKRAKPVSNPLIAIMAIAKDGDADDMSAKKQDYINLIFTFNHILKYCVVYKSIDKNNIENSSDKKSDDDNKDEKTNADDGKEDVTQLSPKLNYIQDRMKDKEIKSEVYQLLWTKKEIHEFGNDVYKIVGDKNNKHDGIFFFILWNDEMYENVIHIRDSYGDKYVFPGGNETFYLKFNDPRWMGDYPKVWFVESYKHIDGSQKDANKMNHNRAVKK